MTKLGWPCQRSSTNPSNFQGSHNSLPVKDGRRGGKARPSEWRQSTLWYNFSTGNDVSQACVEFRGAANLGLKPSQKVEFRGLDNITNFRGMEFQLLENFTKIVGLEFKLLVNFANIVSLEFWLL